MPRGPTDARACQAELHLDLTRDELLADPRNTIDREDAHPFTGSEGHIRIDFLDIGPGRSTILAYGDLDTLVAGDAFFGCRTGHTAGHRTQYPGDDAATATTDRATSHPTDHRTSTGADIGLGTLDLHQPNRFDGAHAYG